MKNNYLQIKKDFKQISKKFPLYFFGIEFNQKTGRLMFSIPIQMRMDDRKYKLVRKEINTVICKTLDYKEYGGGTGFDGFYDIDLRPKDIEKWTLKNGHRNIMLKFQKTYMNKDEI